MQKTSRRRLRRQAAKLRLSNSARSSIREPHIFLLENCEGGSYPPAHVAESNYSLRRSNEKHPQTVGVFRCVVHSVAGGGGGGYNASTTAMDPLSRLFGNPARLKLLRLFMFNDDSVFSVTDAAFRSKTAKEATRKELNVLLASEVIRKKTGKGKAGFIANKKFTHFDALQEFIRNSTDVSDSHILTQLRKSGTIRVVALSGLFTGAIETKVDLLVVGDKLEERILMTAIHSLEAELGRELRFASFTTEEFKYRVGVYDRLVRDVFDYPHRTILDRIGG